MPKKQKRQRYQVSGVIQFEIHAGSAEEAVEIATERANLYMDRTSRVIIDLDNIATHRHASVALADAATLDEADADDDT